LLEVVPVWSSDGQIAASYTVFCHLLAADGTMVAQADGIPLVGHRPTTTWRAGEELVDSYLLPLPEDVAPGRYELSLGMYLREAMERLPVVGAGGVPLADDRVVYGTIEVVP